MDATLILEKLFSRYSFYDIAFQSLLVNHIWMPLFLQGIFSKGPVLMLSYLIVYHLCGCFSCFRGLFQ